MAIGQSSPGLGQHPWREIRLGEGSNKRSRLDKLFNVLGVLLAAVALVYLARSFHQGLTRAGSLSALLSFKPWLFAASMALLMVHMCLAALSWMMVSGIVGCPVSYGQAFAIHFLTQVGKYVPGKVWAAVGKVGLTRTLGLSATKASHAMVLESLFIVSGSMIVALPLVPVAADHLGMGRVLSLVAVSVTAGALVLTAHPTAFRRTLRFVGRITGKTLSCEDPGFFNVVRLLPIYLLVFLTQGLAFVLLAWSFGTDLPLYPGMFVFPMAMVIGFIVVFAPGGLGVREVTLSWLVALSAPTVGPGQAELLSIAARLWITLVEALAFGIAVFLWGGGRPWRIVMGRGQNTSRPSTAT
ncbi:hypothetical protein GF402_02260 [Candidatus Fermentibacteria bacterium]|nr:hypothetical protein [Candidatus Fermentibacteria bacterium]